MGDFPTEIIEVRYYTTDMGPYSFNFEPVTPEGALLSSVNVRSFSGRVKPGDDLAEETETTDDLIDSVLTAISGDYCFNVYFNYPGSSHEGNHTLVFEITYDTDAKDVYYFYRIKAH